jgi:flagellar L-ring protein precursor FlgH
MKKLVMAVLLLCAATPFSSPVAAAPKDKKKDQPKAPSALDRYIEQASQPEIPNTQTATTGSLWTPAAWYSDLAADQRARRVDDIATIVVQESASAVSTGATQTSRKSSAQSSITALAGVTKAAGPWANLANLGGQTTLNGQGTTSRTTTLTTTVSARVTHVLRNGNLVLEGTKNVMINSENQTIIVRGVIRPIDLDTNNTVFSARLAQMEIQVNGKGVVADAVHRPNILYRLLLGILPF